MVLFFPYMFEKFKKLCFGGCFLLGELDSEAFLVRDKDIWKSTEHSLSCTAVKAAFRRKHFFLQWHSILHSYRGRVDVYNQCP